MVGNLPSYIASPAIAKLIEARSHILSAVLMVQKISRNAFQAPAGSEARGAFSVFAQYYCDIKSVARMRNVFYPIPECGLRDHQAYRSRTPTSRRARRKAIFRDCEGGLRPAAQDPA